MRLFFLLVVFFSFNSIANCYIPDGGIESVERNEVLSISTMNGNELVLQNFGFTKKPMCRNILGWGVETIFDIKYPTSPYFKYDVGGGRFIYLKANYPGSPNTVEYKINFYETNYKAQDINEINKQNLKFTFDVISANNQNSINAANLSDGFEIRFEPRESTGIGATSNKGHKYVFKINPDVKLIIKTCKFLDGVLSAPDISINDLRGTPQSFFRLEKTAGQVAFKCTTGVSSDSFRYHFESSNAVGSILKNEDARNATGAGDVGFEISLDGANKIYFDSGSSKSYNLLSFNEISSIEQKMDLVLYGKYVVYSDDFHSGSVRSLVKVVVEYY